MNQPGDNHWDIRPSGQPSPLDDEATPTVIVTEGEHAGGATELIGSSASTGPTSHMPFQPESGWVPDSSTPFQAAPGSGDGTTPFEPYSGGGHRGGRSTTLIVVSVAIGLVLTISLLALIVTRRPGSSKLDAVDGSSEFLVTSEPAGALSTFAYMTLDERKAAGAPSGEVAITVDLTYGEVGTYNGNLADTCDVVALTKHLTENDTEAGQRWATAAGVVANDIVGFLSGLTASAVVDTQTLTLHGDDNGQRVSETKLIDVGTAVLVDETGSPRVRCLDGNPLTPSVAVVEVISGGEFAGVPFDLAPGSRPELSVPAGAVEVGSERPDFAIEAWVPAGWAIDEFIGTEFIPPEEFFSVISMHATCDGFCEAQDWGAVLTEPGRVLDALVNGDLTLIVDEALSNGRIIVAELAPGEHSVNVYRWNDDSTHFFVCSADAAPEGAGEPLTTADAMKICLASNPLWLS